MDTNTLALPHVRALAPYQPGKPIEELEREYGVTNAIKLASNENPFGPSPRAVAAIGKLLNGLARYPDGSGFVLKRALAAKLAVSADRLTLGNGSNDVLELCARAFAGRADEIVFAQHAFAVYAIAAQAVGARAIEVPAREYGHDLGAMARAITPRTKLVYLANPNNPTGTWFDRTALQGFLTAVPARVMVVVDEAYFEYVCESSYPNGIEYLARFPNLVVTRTFSKAYGLAGLRIGYAISAPAIADLLNRVRQPFNVNSLALAAAEAALGDEEFVAHTRAANLDGMQTLVRGFERLGLRHIPSTGNFVCVEVGDDAKNIYERLLRRGVIVRPVANYGLPRHLRITVGTPEENARFLDALEQSLQA